MPPVLVANADRMMTSAESQERGIRLTFADGRSGLIPFNDLPEIKSRANLQSIEIPNPYELVLRSVAGSEIAIPWDFARHYCDASYEPRVRAVSDRGKQSIGARIRGLRQSSGLSQDRLAANAGISRVTLVRIEKGGQSPRYETLQSLARAIGRPLGELLAPDTYRSS